ncbi:MAG TPA: hypothetical protein PKX27_07270 [Bacteroidales bacterium]|jgi:hypothetical protein|nr:hypothetical protein [Bacteroidales bacterium]HPM87765.1 hypothetical protein [Bacteroidales bacterium]
MAKLSTREGYLRRELEKKKAMIKGKKYHASTKKSSSKKYNDIQRNNSLIIDKLKKEL